jgi:hypothetical protein
VKAEKRRCAAIEQVERGAGARVDLEQKDILASHQKIGRGEPFDLEAWDEAHDGGGHPLRRRRRDIGRTHGAAIAARAA